VGGAAGGTAAGGRDPARRRERGRGGRPPAFFRDGRLTEVPTKAAKRRIVLERVAIEFEPGRRYDEREVNAIVGRFANDHASLRRHLVDEGFLAREGGVYWRTGGRVDV
jgi:hypothetical protein